MGRNFIAVLMLVSSAAFAQDVKTVVDGAAKAMGIENVGSVRYTGSGLNFALGQAVNPSSPWPKFNVKKYERVIDFDAGAASQIDGPHAGRESSARRRAAADRRRADPVAGERVQTALGLTVRSLGDAGGFPQRRDGERTPPCRRKPCGGKKYNVVSYHGRQEIQGQRLYRRSEHGREGRDLGGKSGAGRYAGGGDLLRLQDISRAEISLRRSWRRRADIR